MTNVTSFPVQIRKDGSLLTIGTQHPDVKSLLERTLTYDKRQFVFGRKQTVKVSSVRCFDYVIDKTGEYPDRFVCPAGYLHRIVNALRAGGFKPMMRNLRNTQSDDAFEHCWDRLDDIEWRWMQQTVLQTLLRNEFAQIRCPPGYGKSFLIKCLCKLLPKARILITTYATDVLEQIYDNLTLHFPSVGLRCSRRTRVGERITCCSLGMLHHYEGNADIVIADEVHEMGSDNSLERLCLPAFRFARRWAFSANVEQRLDNAHFEIEGVFGPLLIDLTYNDCVANNCVVPIKIHWRDVIMDVDPSADFRNRASKLRHGIWRNDYRNNCIAADARSFPNDQVLITVETIEHAMCLKKLLPEFTLCYSSLEEGEKLSYIRQGLIEDNEPAMTVNRRVKLKQDFESGKLRKVIATGVWKRGVDFKNLQVLIRADAGASIINDTQIPGRTSRIGKAEKEFGITIDYLDQFSSHFKNRAATRRSNYKQIGWEQLFPTNKPQQRRFE